MTTEYNANQARQEAEESSNKFLVHELKTIITTIKLAAREGRRKIYIDLSTYAQTIEELKKRGFGVQESNNKWYVSW